MSKLMIITNYVMIVIFLLFAGVQLNDPDPILWVSIYGITAILCVLAFKKRLPWGVMAVFALVCFIWAGTLAPSVLGKVSFVELFSSVQMKTMVVERGREMGGLLIAGVWLLLLALALRQPVQVLIAEKWN